MINPSNKNRKYGLSEIYLAVYRKQIENSGDDPLIET